MELITRRPERAKIAFNADRALRFAHVPKRAGSRRELLGAIEAEGARLRDRLNPVYRYGLFVVDRNEVESGLVHLEGGPVLRGSGVCHRLENCRAAVLFVATLGMSADDAIGQAYVEDPLDGFLLDSAGSSFIESLREVLEKEVGAIAAERGWSITQRHSPGFHGWMLSDQEVLFDLLHASEIGLSLTKGYLMVPQKSLSGLYGLRAEGE